MLIPLAISAELAAQLFSCNHLTRGLPEGAKLVGVSWRGEPGTLVLCFEAPGEGEPADLASLLTSESEIDRLAHAFAWQTAADLVSGECSGIENRPDGKWMRFLPDEDIDVADALRYLELAGKLIRAPDDPNLIRLDSPDDAPAEGG